MTNGIPLHDEDHGRVEADMRVACMALMEAAW